MEAWDGSLAIPEVQQELAKAIRLVERGPEITFQGESVKPKKM